jgi:hypothetical protein
MAISKPNAVQDIQPSEYVLFDSSLPDNIDIDIPLIRSAGKAAAKMLSVVISTVKGCDLSGYALRLLYKPTGYSKATRNTLRLEFTAEFTPHVGATKNTLVSIASKREGLPAENDMG